MILAPCPPNSPPRATTARATRMLLAAGVLAGLLLGGSLLPVSAAPGIPAPAAGARAFAPSRQPGLDVIAASPAVTATQAALPATKPAATLGATPLTATRVVTATVGGATGAAPGAAGGLPAAAQTGGPAAVQTGGPQPIQTGGPQPIQTGPAAPIANNPPGTAAKPLPTPADSGPGALIPWVVGAIVLLGLLALAALALRRSARPVATASAPLAGATTAPLAVLAEPPPVAPVTQIRCPNCGTVNPADRRFCDECGQDLRPAVAAVATPALPVVDEATTPYLETLSRVDEQLEFVLARNTVTIGRALDNDIVIDDQFIGWQTVSPHHARLTRQADGFLLEDLASDNGTFVNSARTGRNLLDDGMTLALGTVEFVYRVPRG